MATEQSENARIYAFSDMKSDIITLHNEVEKMKSLLRIAAYPKKGTAEYDYDQFNIAEIIQNEFTLEDLE